MFDSAAEIDYLSKVDFSKGFCRFHIKWPLTDLSRNKGSAIFTTTVNDGQQNINLTWSLLSGSTEELQNCRSMGFIPAETWFRAFLRISDDKTIPMIFQASLLSSSNVLLNRSSIAVTGKNGNVYVRGVSSNEVDGYPVNDLVFHFWMDIPKAVVLGINKKRKRSGGYKYQEDIQRFSTVELLWVTGKVFSRVMGTEFDPLSDTSIIIVKKVEEICDGKIIKKEEELRRFPCHTIFLAGRSTVFERMLTEEWKETCAKDGRSVRIDDIDAQIMETVLRYIYTSSLPDLSTTHDDLFDIIYAADKYNLTELKNWCCALMIRKYDSLQNRLDQLVLADRHSLVQLKAVCLAQLSMCFPTECSDRAFVSDLPDNLYSDIMEAISERNRSLITIELRPD